MKKIIYFILIITAYSCLNKSSNYNFKEFDLTDISSNIKTGLIDVDQQTILPTNCIKYDSEIKLSTVFSKIDYIPLESTSESLIGQIDKIIPYDSCFIIVDKYKTRTVKQFKTNGKFIRTIGRNGKGPGEYYEPTDCILYNDTIIIYDQFQQKMIYYNNEGKMINEKKVPFIFNSFHKFNNNSYLYQMYDSDNYHLKEILGYSLIWCDSLFNIKYKSLYKEKDKYNYHTNRGLVNGLNDIYFHAPYCDSVYKVKDNGEIKLEYLLDPINPLPEKLLLRKNQNKLSKMSYLTDNYYILFTGVPYISENVILYQISYNKYVQLVFYNKNSKTCVAGDMSINDLSKLVDFGSPIYSGKNYLITYQNAYEIIETLNNYKKYGLDINELGSEIELKIAETIDDFSNPVLMYYYYKE